MCVVLVELRLIGGSPVVQQARGVGGELERAVPPVGMSVEVAVAGRGKDPAAARLDHRARSAPDRRPRAVGRAGTGVDQDVTVRALAVPEVEQTAAGPAD